MESISKQPLLQGTSATFRLANPAFKNEHCLYYLNIKESKESQDFPDSLIYIINETRLKLKSLTDYQLDLRPCVPINKDYL